MSLTQVHLEHFTAFTQFRLEFSPGINVFVGANGTGKTHLMKVCYAACDAARIDTSFAEKLVRVFLPSNGKLGRLARRQRGRVRGTVEVFRENLKLRCSFSAHAAVTASAVLTGARQWQANPLDSAYIPVADMLSKAPGFHALYAERAIHFAEIYRDILLRAYRPSLRGPLESPSQRLLAPLKKALKGTVHVRDQEFFLRTRQGHIEFPLLAEGMRKLGLLWVLIQNGTLRRGSVLFWDEPETHLNPKLLRVVVATLLALQRQGVQVFLATHNYVILREFDLQLQASDKIAFHSLYHVDTGDITSNTTDNYLAIHPNAIDEAFSALYDREVERSLAGTGP